MLAQQFSSFYGYYWICRRPEIYRPRQIIRKFRFEISELFWLVNQFQTNIPVVLTFRKTDEIRP